MKTIRAAFLFAILLVVGAWAHGIYTDPLARLERATLATEYVQGGAQISEGNDLYWHVRELEASLFVYTGARVAYVLREPGTGGLTNLQTRMILIDPEFSWNGRLEILAHEAGHVLQPIHLDEPDGEVFAESVSYLVMRHFGHKDPKRSAHYLAQYKQSLPIMRVYAREIRRAARVLTGEN